MKIEIKSWPSGSVLFEGDFSCLAKAVEAAVAKKADLRYANLSSANLSYADLSYANLRSANLSYADLSSADLSYVFDALPALKNPDKEILKIVKSKNGCLEMGAWHSCETTHCRAGWYIQMSGPAGKMLEALYGSSAAGAIIFSKAYPGRKVPNFHANNEDALKDIEANAALTAAAETEEGR